jgi:plasmid stability protein
MPAITIRDVPESVRNTLAARAASRGQSLQEYLRAELITSATQLTVDELIEQVRPLTATSPVAAADILDALDADRR